MTGLQPSPECLVPSGYLWTEWSFWAPQALAFYIPHITLCHCSIYWRSGSGELYGDLDQMVAVEMEERSKSRARKIFFEQRCIWGEGCGCGPGLCWPSFLPLQTQGGP